MDDQDECGVGGVCVMWVIVLFIVVGSLMVNWGTPVNISVIEEAQRVCLPHGGLTYLEVDGGGLTQRGADYEATCKDGTRLDFGATMRAILQEEIKK